MTGAPPTPRIRIVGDTDALHLTPGQAKQVRDVLAAHVELTGMLPRLSDAQVTRVATLLSMSRRGITSSGSP